MTGPSDGNIYPEEPVTSATVLSALRWVLTSEDCPYTPEERLERVSSLLDDLEEILSQGEEAEDSTPQEVNPEFPRVIWEGEKHRLVRVSENGSWVAEELGKDAMGAPYWDWGDTDLEAERACEILNELCAWLEKRR